MRQVFLLGDSIFDNAPYVPEGCEVQAQLQAMLGDGHRVILPARDGDVLADVKTQLSRLQDMPGQSTNLIVSRGGNDVLGLVGHMQSSVGSVRRGAGPRAGPAYRAAGIRRRDLARSGNTPAAHARSAPGL